MEEVNNTQSPVSPGVPAAEERQTPSQGQEGSQESMAERIKGLQRALNQKHAEMVRKEQDMLAKLAELQAELEAYKGRFSETSAELSKIAKERDAYSSRAATLEKEMSRYMAIAKAGLLDYEEKGLLRKDLEGDDFSKYLSEFAATVGAAREIGRKEAIKGAAPPPPAERTAPGPMSKKDLVVAMAEALRSGDMELYQKLADQAYSGSDGQ